MKTKDGLVKFVVIKFACIKTAAFIAEIKLLNFSIYKVGIIDLDIT
jgi:hypothetical protein